MMVKALEEKLEVRKRSKLGGCEGMPHQKSFNHFLQLTQGIFSN